MLQTRLKQTLDANVFANYALITWPTAQIGAKNLQVNRANKE